MISIVLMEMLAGGCAVQRDDRVFTTADSWYNPYPQEARATWREGSSIARENVHVVSVAVSAEAEKMLLDQSWLKLSNDDLENLSAELIRKADSKASAYLMRAVGLAPGNGSFHAYRLSNGDIEIAFSCLGHAPRPMRRQPIILILEHDPRDVFNDVSMAE